MLKLVSVCNLTTDGSIVTIYHIVHSFLGSKTKMNLSLCRHKNLPEK